MEALRVLVVDDEAGIRHGITRALRNYTVRLPEMDGEVRFEVETAGSGEEALQAIDAHAPDLMLLDYKLGGMSGIDVLKRLGRREPDMLTIMITAFATIETAVRATKSGADDFIAKPFTPDELRETVRKAAAHLLVQRQARRLAEEKRRVRFEFITVLGHELKAPLAAIESYLTIAKNRTAGTDLAAYDEMFDRCLLRAEGMRKLIADLLDLTRIESGQKKRELAEVDVTLLAQALLDSARPAAAQRQIALSLTAPGPLTMTADRGELEIVLSNLVSNAIKYNRDGGRVEVRLSADDAWLTIAVRDTGIGLTSEEAGRLFQDFVRIRNAETREIAGSGLGLSIVKKIAQLYGGHTSVESQPGVGSTFTVALQRRTQPQAGTDGLPRAATVAAGN